MKTMNFSDFLINHKTAIKASLHESVSPTFIGLQEPAKYNKDIETLLKLKKKPFPTQATIITAGVNHLKKRKSLLLSCEMGTGKTLMGISLSYSLLKNGGNVFIMSPSHLVPKWASEIEVTLGKSDEAILNYEIIIIKKFSDMAVFKNLEKNLLRFFICSKEVAKLSYPRIPFLDLTAKTQIKKINNSLSVLKCASCGRELETIADENNNTFLNVTRIDEYTGEAYTLSKDITCTLSRLAQNVEEKISCKKCRKLISINRFQQTTFKEWILGIKKNPLVGAKKKYGVAEFVKKKMPKHFIDLLILDEIHELKGNDTAQGTSFGILASCSKKVVGLTGTLLNGYASSIFYILYKMNPQFMKKTLGLKYSEVQKFVETFGSFEREYSAGEAHNLSLQDGLITRKGKSTKLKELPFINPLLVKELLGMTLFLRLDEMNTALPNYKEEIISVDLEEQISIPYRDFLSDIVEHVMDGKKHLLGALANSSLSIPDLPFMAKSVDTSKEKLGIEFIEYYPLVNESYITNKEKALIKELEKEMQQKRRTIVFVTFSELGVVERIVKILEKSFPNQIIKHLSSAINPDKRDKWIKDNYADILICNPELVKTGLDLLDYPSLFFYETGYNVSTLKQASRRAWRIGQKEKCIVKFFTYGNSPQYIALTLMSKKIKALNNLEGRLVNTANELASLAVDKGISIQEQIAKAILKNDDSKNAEAETSEWSFSPREWNPFEFHYRNLQSNVFAKEVKEKALIEVSLEQRIREDLGQKTMSVTFIKNGEQMVCEMTADDIVNALKDESYKNIQLSLF